MKEREKEREREREAGQFMGKRWERELLFVPNCAFCRTRNFPHTLSVHSVPEE